MTSQLKRLLGVALAAIVLLLIGWSTQSGDAVSDTQAVAGSAITGAGMLLLVITLIVAAVLLIRGDRTPQDR